MLQSRRNRLVLSTILATATLLGITGRSAGAVTPSLDAQFRNPPASARPRVWWHWMNGNVTQDGIQKDLAWMKRVGLGGVQVFDAGMVSPQIVPERLVYMSPQWKQAFRFAASEADRLNLELGIAAAPGWSETGGPWVPPEDGLKKIVWSVTAVDGGVPYTGHLLPPPDVTGPFLSIKSHDTPTLPDGSLKTPVLYKDIAAFAFPVIATPESQPELLDSAGAKIDGVALQDDDLETGLSIPRGTTESPSLIEVEYGAAHTIRSATLFLPGASTPLGAIVAPRLEVSTAEGRWRKVAEFTITNVPTTVSFAAVTGKHFRIVFDPLTPRMPAATAPGIIMKDVPPTGKTWWINELKLSAEPRIDTFEAKAGFSLLPDYFALGQVADDEGAIDPRQIINLTSHLRPDGSVEWTPPAGHWHIIRLGYTLLGTTNHPATKEATGLEVDKFNAKAVRRYMDHYLGMYRDAAGPGLFGHHGVKALLTDSIEVGAANWTPDMVSQFKHLRGYDPTPWLPALGGVLIGSRAESDRFLFDYRRTLADLMASEHYGTVAEVAHANGLRVYGEALEDGRPSLGDDMAMRKYTDVPMAALWTFRQEDGPKITYLADMKGAASVAHLYGQNVVAAESMTSRKSYWAFAPSDLRHVIDLEFATGINLPVIHTSVHQPVDDKVPGLSLAWFGQYFNRNETWAEMAKPWVDYMARNALMLQQGANVADVAYFYGEEAPLTGLYGDRPVADAPKTSAYDFVNTDALFHVLKNDGADLVAPSGARYKVLYLGGTSDRMTLATLKRIAALVDGGATVVGNPPSSDPGLASDAKAYAELVGRLWTGAPVTKVGKGQVIKGNDIDAALNELHVKPDMQIEGGDAQTVIPFVHRKMRGGDSYFLVNRNTRPEAVQASFRLTGKVPELWHADTGKTEPVSYRTVDGVTRIPLSLAAEESVFVVFQKPTSVTTYDAPKAIPKTVATLNGPWAVAFQAGRGAPATAEFSALAPLNESDDPGIKYFSGVASYSKSFAIPPSWRKGKPLWLDLGDVREVAEVHINGKLAGTVWHAPFRLDISSFLTKGVNHMEVRVANLWVNRLIGDAQPNASKITFTTMPTYKADAPLRPSGLIGPVNLLIAP